MTVPGLVTEITGGINTLEQINRLVNVNGTVQTDLAGESVLNENTDGFADAKGVHIVSHEMGAGGWVGE